MGVNDIMMAVQYKHVLLPPLNIPITSFDGLIDKTIERGNMKQWAQYTVGPYKNVAIDGDHYFVSTQFRKVRSLFFAKFDVLYLRMALHCDVCLHIHLV